MAAEKAASRHKSDLLAARDEYENASPTATTTPDRRNDGGNYGRTYPIFYSSCKSLETNYYFRTPNLLTRRNFDFYDNVAKTGSIILERLGKHVQGQDFDAVMAPAVQDFILGDKATTQVLEEDLPDQIQIQQADGSVGTQSRKRVYLKSIPIEEVLHTPEAKNWEEIEDLAIYFRLGKDEALKRFPEKLKGFTGWRTFKNSEQDKDRGEDLSDAPGQYLEGWECYSKVTRKVYWFSDQFPLKLLDTQKDPYGLSGFFPVAPFIINSKPSKSLFPTPVYIQVRPTVDMLHTMYNKTMRLVDAVRRRAIVDGSEPDLIVALESLGDNEFVAVRNMTSIVEKGGLQNLVQYLPVQDLVAAIGELSSLDQSFRANFGEWFGMPDILRGISDPIETAAAQEIKSDAASSRFKYARKQVEQLARNSLEMAIDLALKKYSDQEIGEVAGYDYMSPEDKQNFWEAVKRLRDDRNRMLSIDVETDSLAFTNEVREQQKRSAVAQLVTGAFKQIADVMQIDPSFGPPMLHATLFALNAYSTGKELEQDVREPIEKLIEIKSQPQEPPPPPPDYEQMKIQLEQQKLQAQQQEAGMNSQIAQQKAQIEMQSAQMDMQLKVQQFQVDSELKNREMTVKERDVAVKEAAAFQDNQLEQVKLQSKQQNDAFDQRIEAETLQLEKDYSMLHAAEKIAEEKRLSKQADIEYQKHEDNTTAKLISHLTPKPVTGI